MDLSKVQPGNDVPNDVNVIIEIPAHAHPVKYEVDKATGAMFVDRFMTTAMHYPCNYGYIPQTLSDDGDPCDVLVITPFPLITGVVIRVRPIGLLNMVDESGGDAKILAVPCSKLSREYDKLHAPEDVSPHLLETIEHFFTHYKDLEPEKWVKIEGWLGADAAREEILKSVKRFNG